MMWWVFREGGGEFLSDTDGGDELLERVWVLIVPGHELECFYPLALFCCYQPLCVVSQLI